MPFNIISTRPVSYLLEHPDHHPMYVYQEQITQCIKPLKDAFGVEYFCYRRLYPDHVATCLSTSPQLELAWLQHACYELTLHDKNTLYQSADYFSDQLKSSLWTDIALQQYDLSHFLIRIRKCEKFCEFYILSSWK